MTSRRLLRARARKRGTASVEVVVMLPFFILIYAAIFFMHGHYAGRQQAMLTARTCAWQFAADGCPAKDEEKLKQCLSAQPGQNPFTLPSDADSPGDHAEGVGLKVGHVLDTIEKIPVLGGAVRWLFGKPLGVTASQVVQLSGPYVNNTQQITVGGSYYTMCNSVATPWDTLAKDIFCSVLGKGTLGC